MRARGPYTAGMSAADRDEVRAERDELVGRVIDLEVRAAFQAQTIEALDGVLREFAARVEALERQVIELASRPGEREQGGPQDEPPSWV